MSLYSVHFRVQRNALLAQRARFAYLTPFAHAHAMKYMAAGEPGHHIVSLELLQTYGTRYLLVFVDGFAKQRSKVWSFMKESFSGLSPRRHCRTQLSTRQMAVQHTHANTEGSPPMLRTGYASSFIFRACLAKQMLLGTLLYCLAHANKYVFLVYNQAYVTMTNVAVESVRYTDKVHDVVIMHTDNVQSCKLHPHATKHLLPRSTRDAINGENHLQNLEQGRYRTRHG